MADIKRTGAFRYAEDPSTEILCAAVAKDDGEPLLWVNPFFTFDDMSVCESSPGAMDLINEMNNSDAPVFAHNAYFEQAITNHCPNNRWFQIDFSRWRCTAAMSRRAAIPPSLEKAAETLGLLQQKDGKGKALIRKFSIPQKATGRFINPIDRQDDFIAFCEYCIQDVRVEQGIHKALKHFELTGDTLAAFQADMAINSRGLPVNLSALRHAQSLIEVNEARLTEEFRQLTGFNPTQRDVLLKWLKEHGFEGDNLRADTLDEQLEAEDFDPTTTVGRVLQIKKSLSFASIKKVEAMIECACADGRVRGTLQFYGASTGRASGRLIQPQNFKRPTIANTDASYADICAGESEEHIELFHGPLLEVIGSSIRHFIHDPKGPMFDVDFSAVEARISAWLANEEWKLEVFRTHGKIYEATICRMTGMPLQEMLDYYKQNGKHHPDRFKGKVAELACIAEGQLVTTDHGMIPIEQVTLGVKVWDGVSFVSHQGVVYQGIREVLTYENLTATEDHIVFTEAGPMQFGKAARSNQFLFQTRPSGDDVWLGESDLSSTHLHKDPVAGVPSANRMPGMREGVMAELVKSAEGCFQRVPALLQATSYTELAVQESDFDAMPMQQPEGSRIRQLRGEGDQVPVQVGNGRVLVDSGEPRVASAVRVGPDQQQRALRAGESSVCDTLNAGSQFQTCAFDGCGSPVGSGEKPILHSHLNPADQILGKRGGCYQIGQGSSSQQAQTLAGHPRPTYRTRVYDILNCGPHNRFTVSGVLVHNCTYQGGVNALKTMGASDMGLEDEELQDIIDQWREANANIVKLWHTCDRAAKSAVANVGSRHSVDKLEFFCAVTAGAKYLFMRLPSGRRLAYRNPKIEETISRDKKGNIETWDNGKVKTRQSLTYWGQIPGKAMWGRCAIYGGMWVENASQAIAADLLNNGTVNAEKRGIQVATLVHDQCLAYKREGQKIEDLCECLTTLPAWADGLPIAVDGQVQPYYTK